MLISKYTDVTWNSRNKKYYTDIGYEYTQMGDSFEVKVEDLTKGSQAFVSVRCDYCNNVFELKWYAYLAAQKRSVIHKDCCKKCIQLKAEESVEEQYGSRFEMYFSANDKRVKTNLSRYGAKNVFGSQEIIDKIKASNMAIYGVPYTQQSPDVRRKTESTCMEKYGVKNYVELFNGKQIGENSPCWKGGVANHRIERSTHEYQIWRKEVFIRDKYTCQRCRVKNGQDGVGEITLNAHHIKNWKDNVQDRYVVSNGITLCEKCHNSFHQKYGKRNNTAEQLTEYITLYSLDKKIC